MPILRPTIPSYVARYSEQPGTAASVASTGITPPATEPSTTSSPTAHNSGTRTRRTARPPPHRRSDPSLCDRRRRHSSLRPARHPASSRPRRPRDDDAQLPRTDGNEPSSTEQPASSTDSHAHSSSSTFGSTQSMHTSEASAHASSFPPAQHDRPVRTASQMSFPSQPQRLPSMVFLNLFLFRSRIHSSLSSPPICASKSGPQPRYVGPHTNGSPPRSASLRAAARSHRASSFRTSSDRRQRPPVRFQYDDDRS